MKIHVRALRNLIRESLILETECPSCGDQKAYVGFSSVECPNSGCEHYVKPVDSLGGHQSMFAKEFPEAYSEWWAFIASEPGEFSPGSPEDSSYYEFDDYHGTPVVYDKKTHREFHWDEEMGWSTNEEDDDDYEEDEVTCPDCDGYGECDYCDSTGMISPNDY